ncbi:endonuclease domain-containing 1 protein [Silurus asotus]|uniref:Endonuclease domain-containing 1 protein n=1 Tax=Silurus asotus TaxID=30991 RepID=A0AAD5ADU3_SILAS|nr:endonuclease domain-containing 1 protein [Silurus asotus]
MKLLALVLLLSALFSLTHMELVEHFHNSRCSEFFIKSPKQKHVITPTVLKGNQYKRICQRWENEYRFATLYDTKNRIPVYSAYKYNGKDPPSQGNEEWKNEPQLESRSYNEDMKKITDAEMDEYYNQAVNRDYIKYTRGHVFPCGYAADQDQADSTFTFTNVAPQTEHSNSEWAKKVEEKMKNEIINRCRPNHNNPTYIVTGVVPGNKWIPIKRKINNVYNTINKGVNIPSYYWTAFCCVLDNVNISKAYLSLQNPSDDKTYELTEMSVDRLNVQLTRLYEQEFSVFSKLCLT